MTYTQAALALDAAPRHSPDDPSPVSITRAGWSAVLRHTPTPSGRRMPDDLWGEYRLECTMRETLALPFVSLMEFADMRDWTDYREENEDGNGEHGTDPLRPECYAHRRDRRTA